MQSFGPEGLQIKAGHQHGAVQTAQWLLRNQLAKAKYTQPVLGPTIESLNVLEAAGLLTSRNFGKGNAKTYQATRAGETALADGNVRTLLP